MVKLLEAKKQTGKTYTELAKELGLTNLYTAQLLSEPSACLLGQPIAYTSLMSGCSTPCSSAMPVQLDSMHLCRQS